MKSFSHYRHLIAWMRRTLAGPASLARLVCVRLDDSHAERVRSAAFKRCPPVTRRRADRLTVELCARQPGTPDQTNHRNKMKKSDSEKSHILARRAAHFAALEALTLPDAKGRKPSGLSTWRKLRAVENDAHDAATAQCNGEPYGGQPFRTEEEHEDFVEEIRARVAKVLQRQPPPWLKVNGDPRGYALKVCTPRSDPHRTPDNVTECPGLESDWGGYGLLAATIE